MNLINRFTSHEMFTYFGTTNNQQPITLSTINNVQSQGYTSSYKTTSFSALSYHNFLNATSQNNNIKLFKIFTRFLHDWFCITLYFYHRIQPLCPPKTRLSSLQGELKKTMLILCFFYQLCQSTTHLLTRLTGIDHVLLFNLCLGYTPLGYFTL